MTQAWPPQQSSLPPQPPPLPGYAQAPYGSGAGYVGYAPPPPSRPVAPMVLGIIGILIGVVSLLNHSIGLVLFPQQVNVPDGIAGTWPMVDSIVSGLLAIVLLISAIALVRYQPVSRRRMTTWAKLHLTWLVLHGAVYIGAVIPAMLERQASAQALPAGTALGIAYGAAVVTLIIVAIYPAMVLIFLNRPEVKAALDGELPQQASPYYAPPTPQVPPR